MPGQLPTSVGYDDTFLGQSHVIAMPKPNIHLMDELYTNEELRDGYIIDYDNFSVILNGSEDKRSAACVALMVDQTQYKNTRRSKKWRTDPRVPDEFQLDNDYYRRNVWDRGHLARRSTASWGDSLSKAQARSNSTFVYTNAALQHENLNQDEWLSAEEFVKNNSQTSGRVVSFNGCIYGDTDRSITPERRRTARIPSAFYKVFAYIDKQTQKLEVRAFIFYQDSESLGDKQASRRRTYDNMVYQVSLMEVTELTGLEFDPAMYDANPLYFSGTDRKDDENVPDNELPERIEYFYYDRLISPLKPRETVMDDEVDIFINAALVSDENLSLSIINSGAKDIDITGWYLVDVYGNLVQFTSRNLQFGQSEVLKTEGISFESPFLIIYNDKNERIDWVRFNGQSKEPQHFLTPTSLTDL